MVKKTQDFHGRQLQVAAAEAQEAAVDLLLQRGVDPTSYEKTCAQQFNSTFFG